MSLDAVKDFYNYTFEEKAIQSQLMQTKNIKDFIDIAVKLGKQNGYDFTVSEMQSTMSGLGGGISSDIDFEDKWIAKIMQVGWVPLGYTRI